MANSGFGTSNFLKSTSFRLKNEDQQVHPSALFSPKLTPVPPSPRLLLQSPSIPRPSPSPSPNKQNATFAVPKLKQSPHKEPAADSMDNMAAWCQNQERANQQVQIQFDNTAKELSELKSKLEVTTAEVSKLRSIYEDLIV